MANHLGTVWLPIISLKREDAARLGYDSAESWRSLLRELTPSIAKTMKIPLDQFRWYAAFHDEGTHPHVHMVVYSADGKSGFLTPHGIEEIKSVLAKEIFQQDLIAICQRQTQRGDELTEDAEQVMARLVSEMQSGQLENQRVGQLMTELAQRLRNTSGKKQYGYLSPPLKSLVDEIVDELEQDPRIAAAYDLWYREREKVLRNYKDDLPKRVPLSRQKEFKRIKNLIIGEAARLGEVAQEVGAAHVDGGGGADGDTGQSKNDPPPAPLSKEKPTVPLGHVAKSAASLLYQVGQIFEDQRPRPAAGPRWRWTASSSGRLGTRKSPWGTGQMTMRSNRCSIEISDEQADAVMVSALFNWR